MSTVDRRVLRTLQALLLGLPLFLGGRHPLGVALGLATVVALLVATLRERRRRSESPEAVGVGTLALFLALALLTTLPLPPALLGLLSPDTAALYREVLPGWPDAGGWTAWRPLAFDAYDVWYELCKIGIGLGAFVVLTAYPWQPEYPDEDVRLHVFGTLLLTLVAGGAVLATLALLHDVRGGARILWVLEPVAVPGRASGPFANPNHFAGWLEMVIPMGVAYLSAVALRLGRHIARMAKASESMGVQPRRAWASALASHQRSFWLPLLVAGAVLLMLVAHLATGSRGGTMSLLVGLAVVGLGFAARSRSGRTRASRALAVSIVAALVLLSLVTVVSWVRLEDEVDVASSVQSGDVSLLTRIGVSALGRGIVADYPLFGTGLGTWLHAFQLYQAPPVEGGIWQHAHNDYLELVAETGLIGFALAAWFAFLVVSAVRRGKGGAPDGAARGNDRPPGFETADWRAAFAKPTWLRFGVCGGIAAILVHSLVDFSLRLPANLLLLLVLVAMLLLTRPPVPARASRSVAAFLALLCLAILPVATAALREIAGGDPSSAAALIDRSDRALAEDNDRARAIELARRAIDASPADRAAHEAIAIAYGNSSDSHEALRRAIRLDPWGVELRDWLATQLWEQGNVPAATAELEESIARYPYLVSHVLPQRSDNAGDVGGWLGELAGTDPLKLQLQRLDPPLADAVERGLRRALAERPGGRERLVVAEDLVVLLEARERWADAGFELHAAAGITADDAPRLARAANDFLKAGDPSAAEQALIAALKLSPEQGDLYRKLAVEVFAARGDFTSAEQVLRVAQLNSQDMVPVYRGLTKVLTLRESARLDAAVEQPGLVPEVTETAASDDARETNP